MTLYVADPTWGVNRFMQTPRLQGALFTRSYYEYTPGRLADASRAQFVSPYRRCKANRRCNWGEVGRHYV
ncbi:hypothetical protein EON65_30940 [archaeon]|nr:MAG: hypothetical protein EON65_30940 [archaeon]